MSDTLKSKTEFLKSKALNFRTWMEGFKPDTEADKWMSSFNESLLIPTIIGILVPINKSGKLDETVTIAMSHFTIPEDQKAEVKSRMLKYFHCFIEVAMS